MLRSRLKRAYHLASRIAWHLGGNKEHRASGMAVPPGGFVSAESCIIFPSNVTLGENVQLMSGARLIAASMPPYLSASGQIHIGPNSIIRENAILQSYGGTIKIGKHCAVNAFCVIQGNGGINIGDHTLIGPHVQMFSANHAFSDLTRRIQNQGETSLGISIGSDVWIGGGAIILDGVSIDDGAIVSAGAVVTSDVASNAIVAGIPARMISERGLTID